MLLMAIAPRPAPPAVSLPKMVSVSALSGSPEHVAETFLGPAGAGFREMDLIIPYPSPDIRGVVLFKAPVAASPRRCSVEVVTVSADYDNVPGQGLVLEPRHANFELRYKLVSSATDDRCGRLATAKDFFAVEGVDAISAGAEPFGRAVMEARSTAHLSFKLSCQDSTGGRSACTDRGRKALARMDPGKIRRIQPCDRPPSIGTCYTINYDPPKDAESRSGWSIDVVSIDGGKAQAIRMQRFNYPAI